MAMEFVKKILSDLKLKPYSLAKRIGVPTTLVDAWAGNVPGRENQEGIKIKSLCKLRRISGKTWNQFGKELDEEFDE